MAPGIRPLVLALGLIVAAPAAGEAAAPDAATPGFPLRVIKLGGPWSDAAVRRHVEFAAAIGFNAVWVPSTAAGRWTADGTPDGPVLSDDFLDLAHHVSKLGLRIVLGLDPVLDSGGQLTFADPGTAARLSQLMQMARREVGVRDFVVSFEGAQPRLQELRDIVEYGRVSAAAHVALTARLASAADADDRLWLRPAISSDAGLDEPGTAYGKSLLEAMAGLDARVGIVWTGPRPVSPSITAEDLRATRARFGGRRLLLDDAYPANGSGEAMPLALVLGPLRDRDPAIAGVLAGYVCNPMGELGASRLAMLTIADFLKDPRGYDPDASWERAMRRLAGEHPRALSELRTQALEWGGWIGTRNYHTAYDDNPLAAARTLRDPAAVALWSWTVRTYPRRARAMRSLEDASFREDLLLTMERRLAVARAVPLAVEQLQRSSEPGGDNPDPLPALRAERARLAERPEVLEALDRFLDHAGLAPAVTMPSEGPPRSE